MRCFPRPGRFLWSLLGASIVAGLLVAAWLHQRSGQPSSGDATSRRAGASIPLPPYSASRFLNTGPEARYIGTAACAACHAKKHESYLLTAHSKALSDLDPGSEPGDGSFHHEKSGRSYRVYRRDKQLRHEEILRTEEGKEIARIDLPIRYLIGSGHFTRSYLVEIDGFLHESPITWYTSKKKWDMSPGYDFPHHWGFERAVGMDCLACHAGRIEPSNDTAHRVAIHEKAIGCENCHGPGELHETLRRAKKYVPGQEDLTIVNPGKLSRSLQEALCSVCHLSGQARAHLRGRTSIDFRPGMPLTDYRIDYRFASDSEQMTVVGHVEQLRRSACYQKSEVLTSPLTCVTCHDPHAREKPKDSVAFYRQKCLDCHTTQGCKLDRTERLKKDAADNCVACHMPRGDTEIPHIAFTHHRIGKHSSKRPASAPDSDRVPELVPTDDAGNLSELDRKRNLGLAYMEAALNPQYRSYADPFGERARQLLESVHAAGLRDGPTAQALAENWWKRNPAWTFAYAREAIKARDASADVRAIALFLLADCEMQNRHYESAIPLLEEAVLLRRFAEDWRLLGMCYLAQRKPDKALAALRQALAIRPYRPAIHTGLEIAYRELSDFQRAGEHREKAKWLFEHHQD